MYLSEVFEDHEIEICLIGNMSFEHHYVDLVNKNNDSDGGECVHEDVATPTKFDSEQQKDIGNLRNLIVVG